MNIYWHHLHKRMVQLENNWLCYFIILFFLLIVPISLSLVYNQFWLMELFYYCRCFFNGISGLDGNLFYLHDLSLQGFSYILLRTGFFFGICRVIPKRLLEHPCRKKIYKYIKKNPGIHFRYLERGTKINRGTLKYHLDKLVVSNKILYFHHHGVTRFYENNGIYLKEDLKILSHISNRKRRALLILMRQSPVTIAIMKEKLQMSTSSIYWHIKALQDDEAIIIEKKNNLIFCLISERTGFLLKNSFWITGRHNNKEKKDIPSYNDVG